MRTEDLYAVALVAVNVGDINHAYVHADVAHVRSLLTIHDAVSQSIAEASVETVGIANGDGGDARGAYQLSASAVAYRFRFGYLMYLQYGALQRTDGVE